MFEDANALFTAGFLGFLALQRLGELFISRRNTRALLAIGAHEAGARHYPLIVALHIAWLAALAALAWGLPVIWPLVGLYAVLQVFRVWILASLGERWTTRVIVLPGAPPVRTGPYRFLRHPNYLLVACELACAPAIFGLWEVAAAFTAVNAILLAWRIRVENRALSDAASEAPSGRQRFEDARPAPGSLVEA